jgi:hypothetical protein
MKFIIMQFSPRSVFLPFRSKHLPVYNLLNYIVLLEENSVEVS